MNMLVKFFESKYLFLYIVLACLGIFACIIYLAYLDNQAGYVIEDGVKHYKLFSNERS